MASELPPPRLETVYDGAKDRSVYQGAVDIVAVHGLGAHPKWTWVAQDEKGVDVHWLRDLLPDKIPRARIMCFNYDSRWLGNGLAKQTIPGIAKQLLDCLYHEKLDKQRPTIFIGHSFGGVVIEQVLVLANSDGGKYQGLVKSTEGVVFLGTPFRGSKLQSWGKIIANCIKVVGNYTTLVGTSEKGLLKHLEPESEKLDELLDEFTRIAVQNWTRSIVCFYELYETTVVAGTQAMVVDKISGTIPGFTHIPMQTDHCKFIKFGSRDDPNFIIISDNIAELARGCIKPVILTEDQQECLQILFLSDPASDRDYIIDNKGKRIEGTCEWILSNGNYTSWLLGPNSQLLWLSGGPGKGKTFTSVFLTGELEKTVQQQNATLIFFFCDNKNEKKNTAVGILRGLMYQLLSKRPDLFQHILPSFKDQKIQLFTSHSSFQSLWKIFEKMIQSLDSGVTYCVIDGLDECEPESLEILVRYLGGMFSTVAMEQSHGTFKLLVVSRDTPACIPSEFSSFSRVDLDSSSLEGKVASSLDIFLSRKTRELFDQKKYPLALQTDVLKALKEGANRTFLWVALVCKELEKKEISEVRGTLVDLPRGLDEIYHRILLQIDKKRRKTVITILNWVTLAFRPLTLLELGAVTDTCPIDSLTVEEVMKEKIGYCGVFLQIDEGNHVSLIHQSAKDYLLQLPTNPALDLDLRVHRQSASLEITRMCFSYMQDALVDPFPSEWDPERQQAMHSARIKKFPLLEYAVLHWHEHLRGLDSIEDAIDLSLPFFSRDSPIRKAWCLSIPTLKWEPGISKLPMIHIVSLLGLVLLVEKCLLREFKLGSLTLFHYKGIRTGINSKWEGGQTPLHYAVIGGHVETVRLLVEKGADINCKNKDGETALLRAAYIERMDIAKLLVEKGADTNCKDKYGETALFQAVIFGHTDIAKLLVEKGADTNCKDKYGETALFRAASFDRTDITKLLVEKGADINYKDKYGETALFKAAIRGYTEIAKLLVGGGADINCKAKDGQTALFQAAYMDRTDIAKLLIEKGADINWKYQDGETILFQVVKWGHTDIAKLLVGGGADINCKDKHGETALFKATTMDYACITKLPVERVGYTNYKNKYGKAAKLGRMDIAKLLVEKGADINCKNKDGNTALHYALVNSYQERHLVTIVMFLLENGIDPSLRNLNGETALEIAAKKRYERCIKLLDPTKSRE